jgi:hypothetical protein
MEINSQTKFQKIQRPTFCYLCGMQLSNGKNLNRDHCPPENIFAPADRANYPLILQVHEECNVKWSESDEKIGIAFSALHGGDKLKNQRLVDKLQFIEADVFGKKSRRTD